MKFEKIIIPPGWKDTFTKYPNGKTIFEALSNTITTVNEGIEEVNQKVDQGLLEIAQAENIIRDEITDSFNTLKLQLESEIDELSNDLISDFGLLQSQVLTLIAGKADKTYVDAQLADIENKSLKLKNDILNGDFSNGSNWTLSQGITITDNKLVFDVTTSGRYATQVVPLVLSKKYYVRFDIVNNIYSRPVFPSDGPFGYRDPGNLYIGVYSFVGVCVNTSALRLYAGSTGCKTTIDDFMIIDLSTIFGAGNEPTKAEMDTLINLIGWFDGEITVTEKQLAIWILNLIRQNRTAIISLGGTII